MVELMPTAVDEPEAWALLTEYVEYRTAAFPGPATYRASMPAPGAFDPPGTFLIASVDGVASGCGGVRALRPDRFEIKHLFVRPVAQGLGVGRRLLDALVEHARAAGAADVVLDTHSSLIVAGALYRSAGFADVAPYNDNPNADRWLGLRLAGALGRRPAPQERGR